MSLLVVEHQGTLDTISSFIFQVQGATVTSLLCTAIVFDNDKYVSLSRASLVEGGPINRKDVSVVRPTILVFKKRLRDNPFPTLSPKHFSTHSSRTHPLSQ